MRALEMARGLGLEPIYGDTDSIFLKEDPKIPEYIREVVRETGVEIKIDKAYKRVLFMEAKKRYAGLLEGGDLDIVGLEAVRGDWSGVAKAMQEGMLRAILAEGGPNGAIGKALTRPVGDYKVKAPHVEAARRLMADGVELGPGDEVGYVITKGAGKIHERAKPYAYARIDEVDVEYYIANQLIPVASRILSVFGIDAERALGSGLGDLRDFATRP
jgi:DNA polymerase I